MRAELLVEVLKLDYILLRLSCVLVASMRRAYSGRVTPRLELVCVLSLAIVVTYVHLNSLVGCLKELGLLEPCRRQPALPLQFTEVLLIRERFLSILDADDAVLVWFGSVCLFC